MNFSDIIIDDEFSKLIPPLTADEDAELEASVIKEQGFTDPVIVWLNYGIMVDGHNRHAKWVKCLASDEDKAPQIIEKHFDNRDDVIEFMLRRQLARRNLTDAMRIKLALKLKPILVTHAKERQKAAGGDKKSHNKVEKSLSQKSDEPIRVDEEVAKAAGKSRDSVRKVETVLNEGTEEVKASMLAGTTKINAAYKATKPASDPQEKRNAAIMKSQRTGKPEREPGDESENEPQAFKIQRSKTIKTVEALMRAFDDLHGMQSHRMQHAEAIASCKILLKMAKDWSCK